MKLLIFSFQFLNFFMFRGLTLPCTVLSRLWTPSSRRPPAISAPSSWRSGGSFSLSLSLCLSVSLSLCLSPLNYRGCGRYHPDSLQPSAHLYHGGQETLFLCLSLFLVLYFFFKLVYYTLWLSSLVIFFVSPFPFSIEVFS